MFKKIFFLKLLARIGEWHENLSAKHKVDIFVQYGIPLPESEQLVFTTGSGAQK